MADFSEDNTLETIAYQLAMAFGQGSGTMLATPGAVKAAFESFRDGVEQRAGNWDTHALLFIEFARALGTLAAAHAVRDNSPVIRQADVLGAVDGIRGGNQVRPLGICNC
jgi:hypothetical protein